MQKKRDLGEVRGAGVFDLTDVFEHGDSVLMVEGWVAGRHLKDQHSASPPGTAQSIHTSLPHLYD